MTVGNSNGDYPSSSKIILTAEGGLAIKLINKTGAVSVKGACVTAGSAEDESVILNPVDVPAVFGVFYDSGIADGDVALIVVSGIARVLFYTDSVRGLFARAGRDDDDTGVITAGFAISEAIPLPPFATDKHFAEIGHILESRTGQGLARVNLHFN
jgi:hypothetical protein